MVLSHHIRGSYIRFSISATEAFAVANGLKLSGGRHARFRVEAVVVVEVAPVVDVVLLPQPVRIRQQAIINAINFFITQFP